MKSLPILVSVLGGLLLAVAVSPVSAAKTVATYEDFDSWLSSSKTLEARFVQRLESGALGGEIEERGFVYLERPGRMVWKYIDPETKTASIVDGEVRMYVPEDQQMFISPVPEEGDLLPRLLLGEAPLVDLFRVADPVGERGATEPGRVRLIPLTAQGSFESVELLLAPGGELIEAIIIDSAGNTMRYRFDRWRRNRSLPARIFDLEIAPGTEILRPD